MPHDTRPLFFSPCNQVRVHGRREHDVGESGVFHGAEAARGRDVFSHGAGVVRVEDADEIVLVLPQVAELARRDGAVFNRAGGGDVDACVSSLAGHGLFHVADVGCGDARLAAVRERHDGIEAARGVEFRLF